MYLVTVIMFIDMSEILAYFGFLFSIVFLSLTPLPALPLILAAYLRFSYAAIPLVVTASTLSAILQYMIGRYFPHSIHPIRLLKSNRLVTRLKPILKELKLESLVFLRALAFLPSKAVNFGCGFYEVPFFIFLLSLLPMLIVAQFIYLTGANISMYLDSFCLTPPSLVIALWSY